MVMSINLALLFNLYSFSTGRKLFALQQVKKLANGMGLAQLESLTDEAIEHDQRTRTLEGQWNATPDAPKRNDDLFSIDSRVDRTLAAIRNAAAAHAKSADA